LQQPDFRKADPSQSPSRRFMLSLLLLQRNLRTKALSQPSNLQTLVYQPPTACPLRHLHFTFTMPRDLKLPPLHEPDLNSPGVVAYSSVNEATGTSFSAVTDPNNPHAARLARLAVAVQMKEQESNRRRAENRSRSSWLPWLTGGTNSRQQPPAQLTYHDAPPPRQQAWTTNNSSSRAIPLVSAPVRATAPTQRDTPTHSHPMDNDAASTYTTSTYTTTTTVYGPATATQHEVSYSPHAWAYSETPPPSSTSSPSTYPPRTYPSGPMTSSLVLEAKVVTVAPPGAYEPMPIVVRRYLTDSKTAYRVEASGKGGGTGRLRRELYVSAPVGCNEAALFDAVAEENSR